MLAGYTTYQGVSTYGRRNGRVQQHGVEDIEGTSSSSYIPGGMNSPYAWGALGPANIYSGQTVTIGF